MKQAKPLKLKPLKVIVPKPTPRAKPAKVLKHKPYVPPKPIKFKAFPKARPIRQRKSSGNGGGGLFVALLVALFAWLFNRNSSSTSFHAPLSEADNQLILDNLDKALDK